MPCLGLTDYRLELLYAAVWPLHLWSRLKYADFRCEAYPRCALEAEGACVPALEAYINASWVQLLTSTDTATKAFNIVCCLTIWIIVAYTITQVSRL